jgi:hypothetical protein
MKTLEEFKKAPSYVALSKEEERVVEHLARRENRSKSGMIRTLILEALRARALAAQVASLRSLM